MLALGTFDEIPPIAIAILGGFLQQLFGPKNMLMVSAVPSILSWSLLALAPDSVLSLLVSRACAGLAYGLIIGNIFLPNVVISKFLGSFKMIEVCLVLYFENIMKNLLSQLACKGSGSILTFLGLLSFLSVLGINGVAMIFAAVPSLGLIGLLLTKESSVFQAK